MVKRSIVDGGALLWFVPRERLSPVMPLEERSSYRFDKHAIGHRFCPGCGCAPFSFGTAPDGEAMAGSDIRCLEGVDPVAIRRVAVDGGSFRRRKCRVQRPASGSRGSTLRRPPVASPTSGSR